jgi:hypothetical protein
VGAGLLVVRLSDDRRFFAFRFVVAIFTIVRVIILAGSTSQTEALSGTCAVITAPVGRRPGRDEQQPRWPRQQKAGITAA